MAVASVVIKQLCVYIITWNVNSQFPDSRICLDNLLSDEQIFQNDKSLSCTTPDLYVIGFQEVNSNLSNIVSNLFKEDIWVTKFRNEALGKRDYVVINVVQMQGLLLTVFARRHHLLHIRDIESHTTKTGFNGWWGNKGAVSIRMNLYGCPLVFVNAHFHAHDEELKKRIKDYNTIIDKHHYNVDNYRAILDHDYVFWFGDLNFRLEETVRWSAKDIRNMIRDNRLEELFEKDQLSYVKRNNQALHGFSEQMPKFPPTFKFHLNTSEYNMKRRPAWTDRILYNVKDLNSNHQQDIALRVQPVSYVSHPEYTMSDHKPVSGAFVINVFEKPPNDPIIEFASISLWHFEQANLIEYTLPDGFIEQDADYIGVYPFDYTSIGDPVFYEYVVQTSKIGNQRRLYLAFPESISVTLNTDYVLLYIQHSAEKSVSSVVGISNPFKVALH